jgi:succinate dehydrogenase hydrophobic anchor subunit
MVKRISAIVLASLVPMFALAQSYQPGLGIGGLFNFASEILNRVVPLIIAVAVVFFIYQVFRYTISSDEEARKAAKTDIIWGIVGLFIMVSVWGLVAILQSTFGTSNVTSSIGQQLPQI